MRMIEALSRIGKLIAKVEGLEIAKVTEEKECEEYYGCNFQIEELNMKFRKAKITPKKIGQFVTLWKRNAEGKTEPFNVKDDFDFYIIATEQEKQFGFFLFPKQILAERQILRGNNKEGKRGFRVYANWDIPENKQAGKTKNWQTEYFIDVTGWDKEHLDKFKSIWKHFNK